MNLDIDHLTTLQHRNTRNLQDEVLKANMEKPKAIVYEPPATEEWDSPEEMFESYMLSQISNTSPYKPKMSRLQAFQTDLG